MHEQRLDGEPPAHVARHFLELLDDVYHIHGLFLDEITTLRARVAELEAARTSFVDGNGTVLQVPDVPGCAVYLVSAQETIQSWSGGACEIYGYSVEEVLGRQPAMLRPPGAGPDEAAPEAAPYIRAYYRMKKDGRSFEVYLHQAPILDPTGKTCGRIHIEIPLVIPERGVA